MLLYLLSLTFMIHQERATLTNAFRRIVEIFPRMLLKIHTDMEATDSPATVSVIRLNLAAVDSDFIKRKFVALGWLGINAYWVSKVCSSE